LLSEFIREFKKFITIFGKRLNLVKKIIRKTDARLFNKIVYLGKSLSEIRNDITTIKKKISGMIIDRDHVITALAKIVNNEFKPSHSA
jgi:hypothetical protein